MHEETAIRRQFELISRNDHVVHQAMRRSGLGEVDKLKALVISLVGIKNDAFNQIANLDSLVVKNFRIDRIHYVATKEVDVTRMVKWMRWARSLVELCRDVRLSGSTVILKDFINQSESSIFDFDPFDPRNADWIWDDRCLDSAIDSVSDAVAYDDVGDVVELRPIVEMPTVTVVVTEDSWEQDSR